MNRFLGSLVGRLVTKDVEKGTLIINVDAVPRIWNKNKASNPKSVIGKNVAIDGIPNRLLDRLLLTKVGETVEVAGRHDGGNVLTFPGELFRKVAPYKAEDYPVVPDGFSGFQGVITGKIVKKDPKMFGLIVKIEEIQRTWDKSRAKKPEVIVGKTIILSGFWRRKDMYGGLKAGDRIESGVQHQVTGTDVVSVAEFVRKAGKDGEPRRERSEKKPRKDGEPRERTEKKPDKVSEKGFPAGMRGFEGALVGQLVSKDVERGEFVLRVEKVLSESKNSKAQDIKSCRGRNITIRGISNRYLDELLLFKTGNRMEVGAIHIKGESLNFSIYAGKFRKVGRDNQPRRERTEKESPKDVSKSGFPAGMRGFNGVIVGRIVTKDVEKGTFVMTVDAVPRVYRSRATDPKSIIGRNVMVDGIQGRFLDLLLLTRKGESLLLLARHNGGDHLTYPGELLRKVDRVKPGDYPELPDGFQGFRGVVIGKIAKKNANLLELTLEISKVASTSEGNRAKKPESAVGKKLMVGGFWRIRDRYQNLKVGDIVEAELKHIQPRSDHVDVGEFRKVSKEGKPRSEGSDKKPREGSEKNPKEVSEKGFPAGMRGFRGILIGRVVSRDVEKGKVVIRVERVKRLNKPNKATEPNSAKGHVFTLQGFSGKILDVVLSLKPNDRVEFGAAHIKGDFLDRGEVFRKIE